METTSPTEVARGQLDGSSWEMASRSPCTDLVPYVRRLVGYDERSPIPKQQRQFPEPFVVLIIEFGPPLRVTMGGDERSAVRHPGGFVVGLGDSYADTLHDGHQRGIQIDLTPTGARRFLGMPLSELGFGVVAVRDILPSADRNLSDRLDALPDWASRLDLIEALLASRILTSHVNTARVDWAVDRIEAAGGNLRVGTLSDELGCSPKHLISLFRDQVGIPPKLLSSLVRFERVMSAVRTGTPYCLAELAMIHGYSDQAHLAREVKRFTGLTATEARARLSELVDLFG